MLKKSFVIAAVCIVLLMALSGPAAAILKVLEPELSEELREIAKAHIMQVENVSGDAITIEDGWVREYWNVEVDVYMVVAVVDKGLATERKLEIPVRVDRKAVLGADELAALEAEDNALAPEEPVARILMAEGSEAAAEETAAGAGNVTPYILAAALAAILVSAALIVRRKAAKGKA